MSLPIAYNLDLDSRPHGLLAHQWPFRRLRHRPLPPDDARVRVLLQDQRDFCDTLRMSKKTSADLGNTAVPPNVPALPTRRSESAAARLTRAQRARRDAAHMSVGVCRDITIFDLESRPSSTARSSPAPASVWHPPLIRWPLLR